ncbi:MAG: TetR/AcrR family transcriptional regulator [Bacteroidales bacterium]
MPRTEKQLNAIRKDRREQIMNTALTLFSREGYGHVSISMLARHAGISKGLMYNYFKSKEQLLKEILDSGMKEIVQYFDPNNDGRLTPQEFEHFVRNTFRLMRDNREFWIKFFSLIIQPNVKILLKDGVMAGFMRRYFKIFEEYFKDHGFRDPELEVFQLSALIEGFGIIMLYYEDLTEIPVTLFKKFEERIIQTYT